MITPSGNGCPFRPTGRQEDPRDHRAVQEVTAVRPGLTLVVRRACGGGFPAIPFELETSPVFFGFLFSGANRCVHRLGPRPGHVWRNEPGSNGIRYLPRSAGVIEPDGSRPMCSVSVHAEPGALREALGGDPGDDLDGMPAPLLSVLEERRAEPFVWTGGNDAAKRAVVSRILHCPYHGPLRSLFLEIHVLDFLLAQIVEFIRQASSRPLAGTAPNASEIERLEAARALLLRDLENPPGLGELARAAGLGATRLKQGFHRHFGAPVFAYLREFRLERARDLLDTGEYNVTEAALNVGFASISHFCRAFRLRFGISPKQYLLRRPGRWK